MGDTREGFTGHLVEQDSASALRWRKVSRTCRAIGVTMSLTPYLAVTAVIELCAAGGVWAQDSTYRSVRAMSGQSVRLSVHFTLKQHCSAQPAPDIRVVTPPSNGTLSVRVATARA